MLTTDVSWFHTVASISSLIDFTLRSIYYFIYYFKRQQTVHNDKKYML